MTRVYAIHSGAYSDQHWGPVFSTVEKALAYIKKNPGDESQVEPYVLDDENDTGPVYPQWVVVFDKDGNVLNVEERGTASPYEAALYKPHVKKVPKNSAWYFLKEHRETATLVVDFIYAPDEAHAVKIAADERFRFRALQLEKSGVS